jgi:hypothetical protein
MPAPATPPVIAIPFASSGVRNVIPVPSQIGVSDGAASLTDGFPPRTMLPIPPGIPPDGKDFNGIFFEISSHTVWTQAGGRYYWNSVVAAAGGYPLHALLASTSSPTLLWLNLSSGNATDPDGGSPANWQGVQLGGSASGILTPSALAAGDTNNWNPGSLSGIGRVRVAYNSAGTSNITGMVAAADGTRLILTNVSAYAGMISGESTSSTTANRFSGNGDAYHAPGQSYEVIYDGALSRWSRLGN